MPREQGRKVVASNRKAYHDYAITDTFEAGMVLTGTEVKSLRSGRASLVDAFAQEKNGELYLYAMHIPEYAQGTWTNHAPRRRRKLLLHKNEIVAIDQAIRQSREALARDPRSRFLDQQLNSALDKKVELLRTAALLPSRT